MAQLDPNNSMEGQTWKPLESSTPNSQESESNPVISRLGFREYDARWLYPEQVNLLGFQCIGAGLGTQLRKRGHETPSIVVGHDYRSYSQAVKHAVTLGLLSAGCHVHDIGLSITPMAYFAQQMLGGASVAMITASHNENGWTGIKVGEYAPITHGPVEMAELRDIVLAGKYATGSGQYSYHPEVREAYLKDLSSVERFKNPLKIVVAAGNGTAGAFAPIVMKALGCEVIEMDCNLDWTFPNYNPNPEDLKALHALADEVKRTGAAIGLLFDGDCDRVGVVDETGEEIFSDKVGLLIARRLAKLHPSSQFVVDVKSTGLFRTDPTLIANGAQTEYWITGHSYIKRRIHEKKALAGFEKSGHFFFNPPVGRGYDDAIVSATQLLRLLDEENKPLSAIRQELQFTWQTPSMSPYCDDAVKYDVVNEVLASYKASFEAGEKINGLGIVDLITVNGVRVVLEDGTWGLVRASSNKPCLVVVTESPVSDARMRDMFFDLDARLKKTGRVGEYDQVLS